MIKSFHFEVFLTVNSLAKVYWDGSSDKRRLELNWVNPPDVRETDYVGLYRRDPQWYGLFTNKPIVRVAASQPGQYYLTSEEFPDNNHLHPYLVETPLTTRCQHHYWIAYIRAGRVLAVNCIKTQPQWMWEMKDYIGSIPLHAVMLPGSHNSGSYDKFESYADDTVLMRYSVNQGEDIWAQLLYGIRRILKITLTTLSPEKKGEKKGQGITLTYGYATITIT